MAIRLTIDGRQVAVEPGATVLDAARRAGVEIPTLCYREDLEPWTSCFLCVVQVDGKPDFTPACVTPVREGMVVAANSEDVRAARRAGLELLLSDHRGDCVAPCSLACPAGLDIPGFIAHVQAGRDRQAIALIKERIPLAATLGRVCPRYCERVCRRRESEEPVAVCALKRFAADADLASAEPWTPDPAPPSGRKVAIVGAGPAGLSAAFYLLRRGHAVTLLDAHPEPGGMLRYGIPEFRLPNAVVDGEVGVIERMGAEFRTGCRLGEDVSLNELRAGHDAVLLTLGAQADGETGFKGADLCTGALEFLRRTGAGEGPELGESVAVIGGGNEAVAAARTALRLGCSKVMIVWEGERRSMPCFGEWVDDAVVEGVTLETEVCAVRVERTPDGALRLTASRGGDTAAWEVDRVMGAPQRRPDAELFESLGLETGDRGLHAARGTFETGLPGVFAAGDAVTGPATVVRAVGTGRQAALCIGRYVTGWKVRPEPRPFNVRMGKLSDEDRAVLLRKVANLPRAAAARLVPGDRATGFEEVDGGLSEDDARGEAGRCLQCDCLARDDCKLRIYAAEYGADVNRFKCERPAFRRDDTSPEVVYERGKCVLCGICVRIAESRGERIGVGFSQRGFGTRVAVPFDRPLAQGLTTTLRLCAEACPTGALAFRRPDAAPSDGG